MAPPLDTKNRMGLLANLAWYTFKLSFGLFSLASVWVTAVIKNGVLWTRDTVEEKQELAAGMFNS